MKIIFDMDYTLLDTKRFQDELAGIFSREDYKSDYKRYFKDKGINFDFEKYLDILKSEGRIDSEREEELRLKLGELTRNMDNYLYPKVENVLKYFKESGVELILITFGNKKWQKEKVKNLSVKKYFSRISFEEENKGRSKLLKLLKTGREEVLIINDNAEEAKEMVKISGKKAKVFLIDGPYAKNIKHGWPIYKMNELIV
jgi:FMN phosphatase YigB (HAD superfamily)